LHVGDLRVFYDVEDNLVYVMRILAKEDIEDYLKEMGYEG
jgi:mRNA-degrading endonuclease RelE of RelBE toxin-antitoxin system